MRNKAARTQEANQAMIRDQTTGADGDRMPLSDLIDGTPMGLPEAIGFEPLTQQSEARIMSGPVLMKAGSKTI